MESSGRYILTMKGKKLLDYVRRFEERASIPSAESIESDDDFELRAIAFRLRVLYDKYAVVRLLTPGCEGVSPVLSVTGALCTYCDYLNPFEGKPPNSLMCAGCGRTLVNVQNGYIPDVPEDDQPSWILKQGILTGQDGVEHRLAASIFLLNPRNKATLELLKDRSWDASKYINNLLEERAPELAMEYVMRNLDAMISVAPEDEEQLIRKLSAEDDLLRSYRHGVSQPS